jgi:hypothetical protein
MTYWHMSICHLPAEHEVQVGQQDARLCGLDALLPVELPVRTHRSSILALKDRYIVVE